LGNKNLFEIGAGLKKNERIRKETKKKNVKWHNHFEKHLGTFL